LKNSATPGHEHFITTLNGGKPEWWNVDVIGVTSLKGGTRSTHTILLVLEHSGNEELTTAIIPTNLFLYFASTRSL